jgi:hypothetical protein
VTSLGYVSERIHQDSGAERSISQQDHLFLNFDLWQEFKYKIPLADIQQLYGK